MTIEPLGQVPVDPVIEAMPKADLHLHQEAIGRLERLVSRRYGRPLFDRRAWATQILETSPPGMARLEAIYEPDANFLFEGVDDADPELLVERIADTLEEGAAEGAVLLEVRFGAKLFETHHDFMGLFREAERRVHGHYPKLCAEAIGYLNPVDDPGMLLREEAWLDLCLRMRREGLAGVDFRLDPYETEADPRLWEIAYRMSARAAEAGLGVTVHAGEFSTANLASALTMPGLRRLGHAVYAASEPRLLERLAKSGATVECSLTCNVILGAVDSYEAHPIRRLVEAGIPVTLNTDLPVHVDTTIGREYAIAGALGFSYAEVLDFTRNALKASFTSEERRRALLEELDRWSAPQPVEGAAMCV